MDTSLKSARYAAIGVFDRYSRHRLFVEEARKYKSVLECGCSTGFLSRLIAADGGPVVVGVEAEAEAAAQARQFCRRVVVADLDEPGWSVQVGGTFDLVTFGDVLEHLADPVRALREASGLLNPGGRVLVSLPNVAHWTVRLKLLLGRFDYQDAGLLDVSHLRFFTIRSARRMLREAGLAPLWFIPVFAGRFTTRARPVWNALARMRPGLFAFQMIFLAEPAAPQHSASTSGAG
jgi:SAM-dependent methyltransferase